MKSVMSTIETGQLCDLASRYLRNQLIPTALCFQNQFDYFPHRARAPGKLRDVVRRSLGIVRRIGNRDGEANAPHDSDVAQVVTDEAAFVERNIRARNNLIKRDQLALRILMDVVHL